MTRYKQWDIVLVPFPFTDLLGTKRRPALIVSPDGYNNSADIVVAFITSNLDAPPRMGDHIIRDWSRAHLPRPSMIRMKFATIDKSIVIKVLGGLSEYDRSMFASLLAEFFAP